MKPSDIHSVAVLKTEPGRQALHRVLLRHPERVMVERYDDQVADRCRVQRDIDGVQIAIPFIVTVPA